MTERPIDKYFEVVKGLRLIDDDYMTKFFDGQNVLAELILRILTPEKSLKVIRVTAQKEVKNLQGRSIRLDILAVDDQERLHNVEVQRAKDGAQPKRARYNSSLIDANSIESGSKHADLPEQYVIFITEKDVYGKGLPMYHVERMILELNERFNDSEHIIYVNGEYDGDDEVGKLMNDFRVSNADEMNYPELSERMRYFKETEKGVNEMCEAVEKIVIEEKERDMINAVQHVSQAFNVSEEDAAEKLGYGIDAYEAAKRHQKMMA